MSCSGTILIPGHHTGANYYYYYITSDRVVPSQEVYFSTEKLCFVSYPAPRYFPSVIRTPGSPTAPSPTHSGWPREYCILYSYTNITNVTSDRVTQAGGQRTERPWLKPVEAMNLPQLCCWSFRSSWMWCCVLYPFSVHVVTFTFHYQLMHLLIKTLPQFTFKTTHVKNVCDAYLN